DHAFKVGAYEPIIRISTDGLQSYPEAINSVFGGYATHGVLKKSTSGRRLTGIEKYSFTGRIPEGQITTSLVERNNATTRNFIKRFGRKTMCYSKKLANLQAAIHMHMVSYNYCWKVQTLKTTPAVAAGLSANVWTHKEMYEHLRGTYP